MVKTVVGATSEDLVWVHGPTICTPTDVKSKEAPLAVISMIADAQLKARITEGFCCPSGFLAALSLLGSDRGGAQLRGMLYLVPGNCTELV